jgi:flagellin
MTTSAGELGTTAVAALEKNSSIANSATAVASAGKTAIITMAAMDDTTAATVTVAGVELTYTAATGEDQDDAAAFFAGRINALGLTDVTASNTGGALTITSKRAFEGLDVATALTAGAGTSGITTLNGAAVTLASGEISQRAETINFDVNSAVNDGDGYKVTIGSSSYNYIAGKGETMEDVAKGLKSAIDSAAVAGVATKVTQDATTKQWSLSVDNDGTNAALTTSASFSTSETTGGTASGGLFGLDGIDVRTTAGAQSALSNIETMIQSSIDGAAAFGSAEGRIKTQSAFVAKLSDALKSGIGSMVDADMEEASARLQALQVQQQLGVQALSIANQSPQSIMSLFR